MRMTTPDRDPETPEERRRRLAAVFGEVLPETTSDERDPAPDTAPTPKVTTEASSGCSSSGRRTTAEVPRPA